ncbi:hypothetical protein PLESTF_001427200 [Pleodorina starrii]|nr:hypothetical protein PLESTF_001427200 [Pleodorina starrii]
MAATAVRDLESSVVRGRAAQQQQLWLLGAGAGREQLQQPSPVQRGPGPLGGGAGAAQQQQQWPLGAGAGREQLQQPSPVQRGPGPLGGGAGAAQQQQQWPSLGQPELGPLGGGAGAAQQLQHWPSLGQPELGPWGGGAGAVQQQQQWPSLGQPGLGPWGGGASAVPQPPASSLQQAPYSVQGLILPPQQQYAPIPLASGPTSQQYASVQLVQPQAPPGDQGRHDQKKAGQREQVPGLKHVPIGARPWPKLHTPSEVYDMYVHGRQADGWPALQQMESDYGSTWRSGFRQRWSEVMEVINLISKTATTVGCTKKEAAAFWTEKQLRVAKALRWGAHPWLAAQPRKREQRPFRTVRAGAGWHHSLLGPPARLWPQRRLWSSPVVGQHHMLGTKNPEMAFTSTLPS